MDTVVFGWCGPVMLSFIALISAPAGTGWEFTSTGIQTKRSTGSPLASPLDVRARKATARLLALPVAFFLDGAALHEAEIRWAMRAFESSSTVSVTTSGPTQICTLYRTVTMLTVRSSFVRSSHQNGQNALLPL